MREFGIRKATQRAQCQAGRKPILLDCDGKGNKVNIAWHKELTVFAKHGADWSAISAFTVAELGEMFCGWESCMLKRIHPVTIKNGLNVFT